MPEKEFIDRAWAVYARLKEIELIPPRVGSIQAVVAIAWTLQNYQKALEIPVVEEGTCGDY